MSLIEINLLSQIRDAPHTFRAIQRTAHSVQEMRDSEQSWETYFQQNILQNPDLSTDAKDFLSYENTKTEASKQGYLGLSILKMDGKNPDLYPKQKILSEVALHLFTIRVVDDYIDLPDADMTPAEKLATLSWHRAETSTVNDLPQTPRKEAAEYMLRICTERFGHRTNYLNQTALLFKAASIIEDRENRSAEEILEADMNTAIYTILPIVDILYGFGVSINENTEAALKQLAKGTRIMDHLGDLRRDNQSGAYNPILEEAKQLSSQTNQKLEQVARSLKRKYTHLADREFETGSNLLSGEARGEYDMIVKLVTLKYKIESFFATAKYAHNLALPILRMFIKSV